MKSAHSRTLCSSKKPTNQSKNILTKDPLHVYCRLRPMLLPDDISCMKIMSNTTLAIIPPESAVNYRNIGNKIIQTSFSHVFGSRTSQKEVFDMVAIPLIKNLLSGQNGLLFTYGVTSSGKTFTMTGNEQNPGIVPHTLDVIFNSITDYQTKKFVFKPDRLNGFEVQNETDAAQDRLDEFCTSRLGTMYGKSNKEKNKTDSKNDTISNTESKDSSILNVDEDNAYAVFLTYVEIYNNSVYDLLEDSGIRCKTLQSKIIREDWAKNMYVHGVTEIEVKNAEEAFEIFQRGQCKKHVAHTALNAESSRSHSVFTVRLVQAPLDCQGKQIIQDKRVILISQLSLVDLAGSERTNRSKNTGQRLREAGNINNSLMTLRTCLETLQENQTQGTNKIVPYRDSKLTHLFKNYFDGEGQVAMIVCVNPRADDYDETLQAMKFAEITQEVQITRPISKLDLGYISGRRQANRIFKDAQNKLERQEYTEAVNLEVDIDLVYSHGGPVPCLQVPHPHNHQIITNVMRYLEQRIIKRNLICTDLQHKRNKFRNMLIKIERENVSLKIDNASLKVINEQQKKKISALEVHLGKSESQIDNLLYKLNSANDAIRCMQQELKEKDIRINNRDIDKQRMMHRHNNKIQIQTDKMKKELETKLRHQREYFQKQVKEKENKLKLVKEILLKGDNCKATRNESKDSILVTPTNINEIQPTTSGLMTVPISTDAASVFSVTAEVFPEFNTAQMTLKGGTPIVNPRYRRSKTEEMWLDHRPGALVPLGTVFQPFMQRRRSVTQLTNPKDFINCTSRYCLIAQEHDTDGELETKLYKGDILPTSGGGAQVIFNDMERLKQTSPIPNRKRNGVTSSASKNRINSTDHFASVAESTSKKPRV